jgi:hypothetical protein
MQKTEQRIMSERENVLSALREKPLKVFEIMKRANVSNEESCQSLLLRMRDEGSGKVRYPQRAMVHRVAVVRVTTLFAVLLISPYIGPKPEIYARFRRSLA